MKDHSRKEWLLETLRGYLGSLSQAKRNELAAELGIIPQFNILFVKSEDSRPKGDQSL
jgi:hypothetical protein